MNQAPDPHLENLADTAAGLFIGGLAVEAAMTALEFGAFPDGSQQTLFNWIEGVGALPVVAGVVLGVIYGIRNGRRQR